MSLSGGLTADATLRIIIRAQNEAKKTIDDAGLSLTSLGAAAKFAGVAAAVALGAATIASIDMAKNFQFTTETLVTGAGEDQKALEGVRQGLLRMASEVGKGPQELAKGLYDIESAGFHGANGLHVLEVSAKAATVTNTETRVVADALTSALNAYHLPASEAGHVTDMMIESVRQGKVEMKDLAANIGKVIPIGAEANVSFKELGAAIAVMTNHGSNAAIATTSLRYLMSSLLNAAGPAKKAFQEVGLSAVQVSDSLTHHGLSQTLQLITDHLKTKFPEGSAEYTAALAKMVGGTRGLNAALNLTGANAKEFANMIVDVGHASDGAGKLEEGWKEHSKDLTVVQGRLMGAVQSLAIIFGTLFLPVLATIAGALIPVVGGFADFIFHVQAIGDKMQWGGNMTQNLAHNLQLLGVPMGAASSIASAFGPALDKIGGAIGAVVSGFQHGSSGATIFTNAMTQLGVPLNVIRLIIAVVTAYLGYLSAEFNIVKAAIGQFFSELMKNSPELRDAFNQILPVIAVLAAVIGAIIGGAFAMLIRVLQYLIPDAVHAAVLVILILADIIRIVGAIVGGVIRVIADLIRGDWKGAWNDFLNIFVQVGTAITNLVSHVFDLIGTIIHAALNLVLNIIVGFVGGVIGAFQTMAHTLVGGSIVPDMVNSIVSWFAGLPGRAVSAVSGIIGAMASVFGSAANAAISAVSRLVGGVAGQIGAAVGAVWGAVGAAISAGSSIGSGIVNGVMSALGGLAGRISGAVHSAVAGATSGVGGMLHAAGVPGFASGGFVPGPVGQGTLATVHGGELILNPTQQNYLMGMMGGGGQAGEQTIVVQLMLDGRQITEAVMKRAGNKIRLQGGGVGSAA